MRKVECSRGKGSLAQKITGSDPIAKTKTTWLYARMGNLYGNCVSLLAVLSLSRHVSRACQVIHAMPTDVGMLQIHIQINPFLRNKIEQTNKKISKSKFNLV